MAASNSKNKDNEVKRHVRDAYVTTDTETGMNAEYVEVVLGLASRNPDVPLATLFRLTRSVITESMGRKETTLAVGIEQGLQLQDTIEKLSAEGDDIDMESKMDMAIGTFIDGVIKASLTGDFNSDDEEEINNQMEYVVQEMLTAIQYGLWLGFQTAMTSSSDAWEAFRVSTSNFISWDSSDYRNRAMGLNNFDPQEDYAKEFIFNRFIRTGILKKKTE